MAMPVIRPSLVLGIGVAALAWTLLGKAQSARPKRGEIWKLRLKIRAGSFFSLQADLSKMFQNVGQVVAVQVESALPISSTAETAEVNAFVRYDVDASEDIKPGLLVSGPTGSVELVSATKYTGGLPIP